MQWRRHRRAKRISRWQRRWIKGRSTPVETTITIPMDRSESESPGTRLKDFYDLTKPRMNAVVIVTTLAGYYLAARGTIDSSGLLLTLLGTALAAAGASVLNQVVECDLDALMPRTAGRPLPAGRIPPSDACLFGVVLAIA